MTVLLWILACLYLVGAAFCFAAILEMALGDFRMAAQHVNFGLVVTCLSILLRYLLL